MREILLLLVGALVAAGIVFGIVVLATSGRHGMSPAEPDDRYRRLPGDRPLTEQDLADVRFDTTVRGYRMSEVDQALGRIGYDLGYKHELIAALEAEVAALRAGRTEDADLLQSRRLAAREPDGDVPALQVPADRDAADDADGADADEPATDDAAGGSDDAAEETGVSAADRRHRTGGDPEPTPAEPTSAEPPTLAELTSAEPATAADQADPGQADPGQADPGQADPEPPGSGQMENGPADSGKEPGKGGPSTGSTWTSSTSALSDRVSSPRR